MTHTNHVIKSTKLGKNVNVRVYGTKGYPIIAFPTQDQMADEWEANGMTDVFAPYVNDGRVQLFTVDSNDLESWSNPSSGFAARIARQEDYYDFVCDELLPFVHETNGSMLRPELTGASLGATQATICALRRPDLFQGVIALSGMYHTSYFFGNWGNALSYANDVNAFLPNTPTDHPYIQMYRQRTFAFSIGQAADEQFGVSDLHFLQQTFERLGINGWFDFWGPECNHDWYWWKQQMGKFLPEAVTELEGVAAAEPELCKPAAKKAQKAEKNVEAGKAAAKSTADKATAKKVENNAVSVKAPEAAQATAKKEQAADQVAVKTEASGSKAGTTKQAAPKATPSAKKAAEPKPASSAVTKAAATSRGTTARHVAGTKAASTKAASAKSVSSTKKENASEVKTATKVATSTVKTESAKEGPAAKAAPAKAAPAKVASTKASGSKAPSAKAIAGTKATTTRSKSTSRTSTARRSNGNAKSTRARKSGKKSAK